MGKDQELMAAVKAEDVGAVQKLLQRPKPGKASECQDPPPTRSPSPSPPARPRPREMRQAKPSLLARLASAGRRRSGPWLGKGGGGGPCLQRRTPLERPPRPAAARPCQGPGRRRCLPSGRQRAPRGGGEGLLGPTGGRLPLAYGHAGGGVAPLLPPVPHTWQAVLLLLLLQKALVGLGR